MNIRAKDAKTVFYLARYAERVFAPMVRELELVGAVLHIECSFGATGYTRPWHITIRVHWKIDGMGLQAICINSVEAVDMTAETFRARVDRKLAELAEDEPVAA
jgi:hypothetical protein